MSSRLKSKIVLSHSLTAPPSIDLLQQQEQQPISVLVAGEGEGGMQAKPVGGSGGHIPPAARSHVSQHPFPLAREVCAKCEIMRFGKVRELGGGSVVSVNVIF